MIVEFEEWTESTNLCEPFTYSLSVSPEASFITLDQISITINTPPPGFISDYEVTIQGQLHSG